MPTFDPVTFVSHEGEISVPHSAHARGAFDADTLLNEALTVIRDIHHDQPAVVVHPSWEGNLQQLYEHPLVHRLCNFQIHTSVSCPPDQVYVIRGRQRTGGAWRTQTPSARINHNMVPLYPAHVERHLGVAVRPDGRLEPVPEPNSDQPLRAESHTPSEHSPEEQRLEKLLNDRIAAGLVSA